MTSGTQSAIEENPGTEAALSSLLSTLLARRTGKTQPEAGEQQQQWVLMDDNLSALTCKPLPLRGTKPKPHHSAVLRPSKRAWCAISKAVEGRSPTEKQKINKRQTNARPRSTTINIKQEANETDKKAIVPSHACPLTPKTPSDYRPPCKTQAHVPSLRKPIPDRKFHLNRLFR